MSDFYPYFGQENPEVPIIGMIADMDESADWELDAVAVFKAKQGYLIVEVSGCSCWPDRGYTNQIHCNRRTDVQRYLRSTSVGYNGVSGLELFLKCQERSWAIQD